jgi:Na+/H+ antiporter NhaD/arsenite permease-like protein
MDSAWTTHWVGFISLGIFAIAYLFVLTEEFTHFRKSKPVIIAAGLIWILVAIAFQQAGIQEEMEAHLEEALVEYVELFLFLLVAMTYVNAMTERHVFLALRSWLISRGFSYRGLFWVTGSLAFFLSPVIDNLTTALVLAAVLLAVGADQPRFIALGCINVVVAANAGGAFSPFGDITTLMVWQHGHVEFAQFFLLLLPSAINFLVPAALMQFAVPKDRPAVGASEEPMKRGGLVVVALFAATLATAVVLRHELGLPPFLGMMLGLGYLGVYGYYLKRTSLFDASDRRAVVGEIVPFDVFTSLARAEWDTLLFFFGVIFCVAGLSTLGYLAVLATFLYDGFGPTAANISIGLMSAVIDNIPMMVAVLEMSPDMNLSQWLLVTLTAGVGGSLFSIGSAAGVALMGVGRGHYTFMSHLRWTPAIALGFAASIGLHLALNHA